MNYVIQGREPADALRFFVECGAFGAKLPGVDMVGFGPDGEGAHTPDKWVDLDSFGRVFDFPLALLAEMARG